MIFNMLLNKFSEVKKQQTKLYRNVVDKRM